MGGKDKAALGSGFLKAANSQLGSGTRLKASLPMARISPRYFLSKLPPIRAIRVIRGSNFGVRA